MLQLVYSDFDRWQGNWRALARGWLSAQEQARLSRFGSAHRRDQFLAGRLLIRQLVADVFTCPPADIRLAATAPVRARRSDDSPLCFVSISHSAHSVAVALAAQPVGIDCERLARRRNWRGICSQYFAADEAAWLLRLPPEKAEAEFLRSWTAKEALSKCTGVDLGMTLTEGRLVRGVAHWSGRFARCRAWSGPLTDGLQVGLVCEGGPAGLRPDCRYWSGPDNTSGEKVIAFTPIPRRS
ncbi:4'-phosphopantetheinyl transferase superfamily protein [Microbulbifer donghaiensis]|uniref:4'-phosphopantetheinyl transferase superfamily protein n=1 Tax=Microbulbifer donghaiensis TaxID=494016 RepID=A0A1M5B0J6_9GAMM|nr:4'-phosphopantetheinyl transferase superfamily protein [Microbulbifer donghaiensis]SHF35692.1 4'-phosphopantetheinyl transferase superfamily protein [Microbulbifer donghaiensis]